MKKIIFSLFFLFMILKAGVYAEEHLIKVYPSDDAYITGGSYRNNPAGDSTFIAVRATDYRTGLMKFKLPDISGEIISARLRLYKASGADEPQRLREYYNDWEEGSVTYANGFSYLGDTITRFQSGIKNNVYVSIDVTEYLKTKNGFASFGISSESVNQNQIYYNSKEALTNWSYLEIIADYVQIPKSISITPEFVRDTEFHIPPSGFVTKKFIGKIYDSYGGITDIIPNWNISGNPTGISVTNGVVTVDSSAQEGDYILIASVNGVINTIGITVRALGTEAVHPSAFYTANELDEIRTRIDNNPAFTTEMNHSIAYANKRTLEELSDIASLNQWREHNLTFTAPEGAVSAAAYLTVSGIGEIYADNFKITLSTGGSVSVDNQDFESEFYWNTEGEGSADRENLSSAGVRPSQGQYFLKLKSETNDDFSAVTPDLAVTSKKSYNISIMLSQHELIDNGFFIFVKFTDKDGNQLSALSQSGKFNRITPTKRGSIGIMENSDAYMKTGEQIFRDRAWKILIYSLEDIRWGMDHLINTSEKLDEAYEAVHVGRAIRSYAQAFDVIYDNTLPENEVNYVKSLFFYAVDRLMDTTYYDYNNEAKKSHNYNADRVIGLSAFAAVFPEYANSSVYNSHAMEHINWILNHSVGEDGSWQECLRYHSSVLRSFITLGRINKNIYDIPKLKDMFEFLIQTQTPVNKFTGSAVYPAIGDTAWGEAVNTLYAAVEIYAEKDEEFAKRAKAALLRENPVISDWFYVEPEIQPAELKLGSKYFQDIGYIIFRQNYGTESEDYMAVSASGALLKSHQHTDRGSFSVFQDGVPLMLDSGKGGYGDGTDIWYGGGEAHNMLTFEDASLPESCTVLKYTDNNEIGMTSLSLSDNNQRSIIQIKGDKECYIVYDYVLSQHKPSLNFHTLSQNVTKYSDRITADCYYGKSVDIFVNNADLTNASVSSELLSANFASSQHHIKYQGADGQDFVSVIIPRDTLSESASIETDGNMLVIQYNGKTLHVVTNSNEQSVNLNFDRAYFDLIERRLVSKNTILSAGEIMLLSEVPEDLFYMVNSGEISIINNRNSDEQVYVFEAVYEDGRLLSCDTIKLELKQKGNESISLKNTNAAVFVWETNNLKPIERME